MLVTAPSMDLLDLVHAFRRVREERTERSIFHTVCSWMLALPEPFWLTAAFSFIKFELFFLKELPNQARIRREKKIRSKVTKANLGMELLPTHQRWVLSRPRSKVGCCLLPTCKRRLMVPCCSAEYSALIHQEVLPGSERRLVPKKDPRTRCLNTREYTAISSG